MDIQFDAKKILNNLIQSNMEKESPEMKPVLRVLKKYGITGIDAISFLLELGLAVQGLEDNDNGK